MIKERKLKAKEQMDLFRDDAHRTNKSLKIKLPIPPSVNHMYIQKRDGGKMLTRHAQNYVRESRALINLAVEQQFWIKQESAVWMYVDIVVYMPDRRIRDSHNMLKLLLDTMQGLVFDNDYYILPRIQSVELDVTNPRVEVFIIPQKQRDRTKALKITMYQQLEEKSEHSVTSSIL